MKSDICNLLRPGRLRSYWFTHMHQPGSAPVSGEVITVVLRSVGCLRLIRAVRDGPRWFE